MVHHPPTTAQVTLYRLTPALGGDPAGLVQAKYLDNGFVRDRVELAGIGCVVVSGVIARDGPPEWTEHLADLTGIDAAVENRTGAGLLLIPFRPLVYVLSWGMGFLLFDQKHVDSGFGLRFAIRRADPDEVRSLTIHALDALPSTAKSSVLGGAKMGAFGMEELGEVLSEPFPT